MKENELLENKEMREKLKDRIQVLNKVKALLLLPNETVTLKEVAKYYEVSERWIKEIISNDCLKEEIISDGYVMLEGQELKKFKTQLSASQFTQFDIGKRAANLALFTQRAVLRIGMLLRNSKVATEVRNQLLNTLEHTTDEAKVYEIDKEKQLLMNVMFAQDDMSRAIAVNELQKYNVRNKEKAEYCDKVVSSDNGISTTVIAKELGFKSATKLNKILAKKKIQYKNAQGQWLLYSDYAEQGYTAPYTYLDKYGNTHHSTSWTEKGKKFIYDLVNEKIHSDKLNT
jgi:phage antirepressor YoqD-like protein